MRSVAQANRILDWHENLQSEEMPPEWMWHLEDELVDWFEEVDRKRKEKYGGDSEGSDDMTRNEFAEGRGR